MAGKKVPDFTEPEWIKRHDTDLYFNPNDDDSVETVKNVHPIPREKLALKKKLKNFWFGLGNAYKHENDISGGKEILIFGKHLAVKFWGLLEEQENWVCAVSKDGNEWIILGKEEIPKYRLEPRYDERGKLVIVELWLEGDRLLKQFRR